VLLHAPPNTIQWVDMERAQFRNQGLLEYLWTPKHLRSKRQDLFPTTQLTMAVWDEFMGATGYNNSFHPKSPISTLRATVPDIPLLDWHKAGIKHISQLMTEGKVTPFPTLQAQWQLPSRAIFSYLQSKSVLEAYTTTAHNSKGSPQVTSQLLIDRCWSSPNKPKTLTLCYKTWQELTPTKPHPHKAQREKDCDITLSDTEWLHVLNGLSKRTKCFSHVEAHRKLMHRWYMTPQRLHQLFPTISPLCWRCKSDP
ncbi:Hypothetical predicted protein, partial [Pelobates cultripes]